MGEGAVRGGLIRTEPHRLLLLDAFMRFHRPTRIRRCSRLPTPRDYCISLTFPGCFTRLNSLFQRVSSPVRLDPSIRVTGPLFWRSPPSTCRTIPSQTPRGSVALNPE